MLGSLVPAYQLLRTPSAGLAGQATADLAASASSIMWGGSMLAIATGIIAARLADTPLRMFLNRARSVIMRPAGPAFGAS